MFANLTVMLKCMGGATEGCGGQSPPPHFWDQWGTGGWSNENDLCFYSRQSLFSTVQVTEFQLPWSLRLPS